MYTSFSKSLQGNHTVSSTHSTLLTRRRNTLFDTLAKCWSRYFLFSRHCKSRSDYTHQEALCHYFYRSLKSLLWFSFYHQGHLLFWCAVLWKSGCCRFYCRQSCLHVKSTKILFACGKFLTTKNYSPVISSILCANWSFSEVDCLIIFFKVTLMITTTWPQAGSSEILVYVAS